MASTIDRLFPQSDVVVVLGDIVRTNNGVYLVTIACDDELEEYQIVSMKSHIGLCTRYHQDSTTKRIVVLGNIEDIDWEGI